MMEVPCRLPIVQQGFSSSNLGTSSGVCPSRESGPEHRSNLAFFVCYSTVLVGFAWVLYCNFDHPASLAYEGIEKASGVLAKRAICKCQKGIVLCTMSWSLQACSMLNWMARLHFLKVHVVTWHNQQLRVPSAYSRLVLQWL
jgi:hypothetical protein